jgi:hypothetical protein
MLCDVTQCGKLSNATNAGARSQLIKKSRKLTHMHRLAKHAKGVWLVSEIEVCAERIDFYLL